VHLQADVAVRHQVVGQRALDEEQALARLEALDAERRL